MSERVFLTFPIQATAENWVSECLKQGITSGILLLDSGDELPDFLHDAPPARRTEINRFSGIETRFWALIDAAKELTEVDRKTVLDAVTTQNNFPGVLDGDSPCIGCEDLLPEVHGLAEDLYKFCYVRLASLKTPGSDVSIRDTQYKVVADSVPSLCCPFCGMARLDAYHPDLPREDLDHILAISKYPFSGVNLMNLVPMCKRCNSSYKGVQDVLYDENGSRSECLFPYGNVTVKLNVECTEFFGAVSGDVNWVVNLDPDTPGAKNWDRIFQVRQRYTESVLKREYGRWLEEMGAYLLQIGCDLASCGDVVEGLRNFRWTCEYEPLVGIGQVKGSVVDLLIDKLSDDSVKDRLHNFLCNAWGD